MRTWIYNILQALALPGGMATRITSSGAAGFVDKPFILVSMGIEQPMLGMKASTRTQAISFDVWIHDDPGSMLQNIDPAAITIKDAFPAAAPAVVGGMSIRECKWEETSNDLYDDHYGTNTRRVSFRLFTSR